MSASVFWCFFFFSWIPSIISGWGQTMFSSWSLWFLCLFIVFNKHFIGCLIHAWCCGWSSEENGQRSLPMALPSYTGEREKKCMHRVSDGGAGMGLSLIILVQERGPHWEGDTWVGIWRWKFCLLLWLTFRHSLSSVVGKESFCGVEGGGRKKETRESMCMCPCMHPLATRSSILSHGG